MGWNWKLPDWPNFTYDPKQLAEKEKQFLLDLGGSIAYLKTIDTRDYNNFLVEILSVEGEKSSKIEAEILDRESLQSSIRKHFGLQTTQKKQSKRESQMAELLCNVYETYEHPLTHEMLMNWHATLFDGSSNISDTGKYRTHSEPMQIVSNRYGVTKVFFEAPPSKNVFNEMSKFIDWFNAQSKTDQILGSAAIAHVYFESIHPFEDGNGRIGRILVEKLLSQCIGKPVLVAISKSLERQKKKYYASLETCNQSLNANSWVDFFSFAILEAHAESMQLLGFLIKKSKMMSSLAGQLNLRQEKVLLRMFNEGPQGFKGGLSAENYIAITKTTRATASRDLADLVEKGVLRKTGKLRHTRYWLAVPTKNN